MPDVATRRRFRHARRTDRRLRLIVLVAAVMVVSIAVLVGTIALAGSARSLRRTGVGPGKAAQQPAAIKPTESRTAAPHSSPPTRTPKSVPVTYPEKGDGSWRYAPGRGNVGGAGGRLLRYRVAVERGIGNVDVTAFADEVGTTLSDPRSWVGTDRVRLQRVSRQDTADFVLYLATPATRDRLCDSAYDRYTSCRNGDKVVINVARWVHGAKAFGTDLARYRQYVINHEVGHRLGHGHELCPGPGEPAPVMQQQTLGMHGCLANAWPLRDGEPYRGTPGAYDDSPPASDR